MAERKDHLTDWLRDAHAMEKQSVESVEKQIRRMENYPEVKAWAREHVAGGERNRELIKGCIERRGGSTSTFKDLAMTVMGNIQAFTGMLADDEVLKNVIADYAFKHYQIACYDSLIAAAEADGDPTTKEVCEGIRAQHEQLAARLKPYVAQMTREYLQLEVAR